MKSGIYASLDIGTTSIKVIVAEILNGQVNVIGVGNEHTTGLSRGMVIDIDETAMSIQKAVNQAEDKAGVEVNDLIVGIPGNDLQIDSCYASISINENQQEITNKEVIQVVEKAIEGNVDKSREGIGLTLDEFIVDGFDEIKDPRGMIGNRIEFKGIISSISKSIVHNIKKSVQKAGFGIQNIILQAEAMSEVALTKDERNFGAILIDLGGGQSSVSVVHNNQLKYTGLIPEGGEYITKDLSIVLNTSIKNAEKLKRDIGHAYPAEVNSDRTVAVDVVGKKDLVHFEEVYLTEIIESRLIQIFEQLKYKLDNIGAKEMPSGIYLSGGVASLPGIEYLAEDIFNLSVKVYVPDFMSIRYPTFTNAIGLVLKETSLSEVDQLINQTLVSMSLGEQNKANKNIIRKEFANEEINHSEDRIEERPENKQNTKSFTDTMKDIISGFFD
ncbi:MAG: cell division protein FtsA [Atopostipes suicloacalis]|nr:cell division protein FtsA [Atopostipes suicloacalis]